jgi:hypothetical protein
LEIAPRFPLSHSLNNNKTNPHKPSKPDTSRAMKTGHFNLSTTEGNLPGEFHLPFISAV